MPEKLDFFYEKSKLFRVISADGAIGGPTPSREVFFAIYNQRFALPRHTQQDILVDGTLGEQKVLEGKNGIFREMEVGIVMPMQAAEELAKFLLQQVENLKKTDPKPDVVKQS